MATSPVVTWKCDFCWMESDIFLWLFSSAAVSAYIVCNKSHRWRLTNVPEGRLTCTDPGLNAEQLLLQHEEIRHENFWALNLFSCPPAGETTSRRFGKIVFNDNEQRIFMEAPSVQEQTLKCRLHGGHSVPLHSRRRITVGNHEYSSALICSLPASTSTSLLFVIDDKPWNSSSLPAHLCLSLSELSRHSLMRPSEKDSFVIQSSLLNSSPIFHPSK